MLHLTENFQYIAGTKSNIRPFLFKFRSQKEDEIEEYLRKKYADESAVARHFGDGGEEMSDEITQQTLLPGVK